MKKIISIIFLSIVIMFAFPMQVSADMGPKPEINVEIINPPNEHYYVALLCKGTHIEEYHNDKPLINYLWNCNKDGWSVATYMGSSFHIREFEEEHSFNFGYDVPDTFKILVITDSGTEYISNVVNRKAFYSKVTYDISTNTAKEHINFSVILEFSFHFLCTCIGTIIVEYLLLSKFDLKNKHNIKYFIICNVITQLMLYISLGYSNYISALHLYNYPALLGFNEIFIVIFECIFYSIAFKNDCNKRCIVNSIGFGIIGNVLSCLGGEICYFLSYYIS